MTEDAATGSGERIIRLHDMPLTSSRQERFIKAAANARRESKKCRSQVRYLDKALAELEEATYGFFGIEYRRV